MTLQEKSNAIKLKAHQYSIVGGSLKRAYHYGENPFVDCLIENALYCDMFPESVANHNDFFGFNRSMYCLTKGGNPNEAH